MNMTIRIKYAPHPVFTGNFSAIIDELINETRDMFASLVFDQDPVEPEQVLKLTTEMISALEHAEFENPLEGDDELEYQNAIVTLKRLYAIMKETDFDSLPKYQNSGEKRHFRILNC